MVAGGARAMREPAMDARSRACLPLPSRQVADLIGGGDHSSCAPRAVRRDHLLPKEDSSNVYNALLGVPLTPELRNANDHDCQAAQALYDSSAVAMSIQGAPLPRQQQRPRLPKEDSSNVCDALLGVPLPTLFPRDSLLPMEDSINVYNALLGIPL